jgi:hypothetical protein
MTDAEKKASRTAAMRKYRLAHPEKMREINRRYLAKNREKIRARRADYLRRYRLEHKEQRSAAGKLRYAKKRDEILARQKVRLQDPETRAHRNAWQRKYQHENRAYMSAHCAKWRKANPEKFAEVQARFYANNPGIVAAYAAQRRALKAMATPPWVDREALARVYVEASRRSLETGVPHDVDHVWPLRGDGFVGLHVPWNLRVIPAVENNRKRNRRPDEYEVAGKEIQL